MEALKNLAIILGAIASIYKSYKEVVKPYINKRRKRIATQKAFKNRKQQN